MNLSRLYVDARVFERDVAKLRRGQRTEVTVSALPGITLEGSVTFIGQKIDPSTRTLTLRTALDNPDGNLKIGMFSKVRVFTGEENPVLSIPMAALLEENGDSYVFVPHADGFLLTPVQVGHHDENHVEIIEGLADGEQVVVDGAYGLFSMIKQSTGKAGHTHSH